MLTLSDFKQKKIIFVIKHQNFKNEIKFHNCNIRLYKGNEFVNQISCHLVLSIFIIGDCTITSVLIRKVKEYGISIFLLNNSFQQYAEIMSVAEGNYALREIQYCMGSKKIMELSKIFIKNKIINQFKILKRLDKNVGDEKLKQTLQTLESCKNVNQILGVEGAFSNYYFKNIFRDIGWYRRAPRTKEDIPNFLLDIGYTFLFNFIDSLLRLFGFDTYKGIYHQLFFQRKSLSCDVMEPIRCLIDYELVKAYNLGRINKKDFKFKNGRFSFKKYDIQKKYLDIWFDLIMKNKVEIYTYILEFYRYLLNPEKYKVPYFSPK